MFRETFIYQVMVFLDCLKHPIKDQVNVFKIEESQAFKLIDTLQKRAQDMLITGKKRDLDQSLGQMIKRESIWSRSKNLINKKPDDPDRVFKYDLANFQRPRETHLFTKKREVK